jgi:hypothetical protein
MSVLTRTHAGGYIFVQSSLTVEWEVTWELLRNRTI